MRIQSKFSDFYDSGLAYGVDPDIFYNRKSETVYKGHPREENAPVYIPHYGFRIRSELFKNGKFNSRLSSANLFAVYFCGKLYEGIHVELVPTQIGHHGQHHYMMDKEKAMEYVRTYGNRKGMIRLSHGVYSDKYVEYHQKLNAPIIYAGPREVPRASTVVVNPCLKDLGFSRIMDPYTAFQELSMFLAGPLRGYEDPDLNPEPTGSEKAAQKGLDPVYGFRHRP